MIQRTVSALGQLNIRNQVESHVSTRKSYYLDILLPKNLYPSKAGKYYPVIKLNVLIQMRLLSKCLCDS